MVAARPALERSEGSARDRASVGLCEDERGLEQME